MTVKLWVHVGWTDATGWHPVGEEMDLPDDTPEGRRNAALLQDYGLVRQNRPSDEAIRLGSQPPAFDPSQAPQAAPEPRLRLAPVPTGQTSPPAGSAPAQAIQDSPASTPAPAPTPDQTTPAKPTRSAPKEAPGAPQG